MEFTDRERADIIEAVFLTYWVCMNEEQDYKRAERYWRLWNKLTDDFSAYLETVYEAPNE